LEHKPSLRELAALDAVDLYSCPAARLAGFRTSPLERKAEPRAVALECVIIPNDPYARSLLPRLGNLGRIGLACYRPVTLFVVPDIGLLDALSDQVVGASLPDPDKLFNAGLEGKVRRAIDFFEGDKINERALKNLVRAAVDYNQIKLKRKVPAGIRAKVHRSKK
jgi:hypothetical protein